MVKQDKIAPTIEDNINNLLHFKQIPREKLIIHRDYMSCTLPKKKLT